MLLGAALTAATLHAAPDSDELGPLAERLRAASVVVDGEAGKSYTAWNGTDPASIVTYTPFAVHRVLKGQLANPSILVRVPGGEIGGVSAPGDASTNFAEGERDIVLLRERDPRDGSYSLAMSRGSYQVTRGANGGDGLDIHLGVDAGSYPSRERGSGTPRTRVPLELVERLARGDHPAGAAALQTLVTPPTSPAVQPAPASSAPAPSHPECLTACIAAAIAVIAAAAWFLWRRRRPH
jgi:hypothetical protein